jgi:serine phosphatase RsbU (regulator of sigma subunit)
MNAKREQFKEERMIDVLRQHRNEPVTELANHMRTAIKSHVQDSPPSDDVTMLIVKRKN